MKKFLFFAIATAMLGMTFTSCDEKENLNEEKEKAKEEVKGDSIKGDSIKTDSIKTFSLIGRWDYLPEDAQVGQGEQRLTLIFDSTNVDVYIVAWGDHLRGTYTYENDTLYFSFKNENAWDALIVDGSSRGWFDSDGALDPETFDLRYTEALPYLWYQMRPEEFSSDMNFLSNFEFRLINDNKAEGGPMGNMVFIRRSNIVKTTLEGKWSNSESIGNGNSYSTQTESFTFKGNLFAIESSLIGVNPQGGSWGSGHKYTGTFTCTESAFTIKVEKFYSFNNDDTWFDYHEYEEGAVGQNFTFTYQIKDGDTLGVIAPDGISLGPGSFLREGEACYIKESAHDSELKVNQFSYDGNVFDVEPEGGWDERMGILNFVCEEAGIEGSLDHHWDVWESGKTVDLVQDGYPEAIGIYPLSGAIQSILPETHIYGKDGVIGEDNYENIFKSGTVFYKGSPESDKLIFKLNAVLVNGKSVKFWLEFENGYNQQ